MKAILETGTIEIAAIADPSPEMAAEAGGWRRTRSWSPRWTTFWTRAWTGW